MMDEEEDRRLEQLVRLYRATRERMDGLDDAAVEQFIEDQFEQGNIVYGVWLDATKPHGIDYEVLTPTGRYLGNRGAVREPGSSNSLSHNVFQCIIAAKIATQVAIQIATRRTAARPSKSLCRCCPNMAPVPQLTS
jgi:hypothetical protein